MTTFTDDELERLLAGAAAAAPEPLAGPPVPGDDEPAAGRARLAWRPPRWLPAAAAVAVALAIGSTALDDPDADEPASQSAPIDRELDEEAAEGGDAPSSGPPTTVTSAVGGAGSSAGATPSPALPGAGGTAGGASSAGAGLPRTDLPGAGLPGDTALVVKEGAIEVEVGEGAFGATVDRVTSLATGLGGYVASSQTSELDDTPRGTVTVRVPSPSFEDLVADVRRLGEVKAVATSGRDVTAEFTDIEARLRAYHATRDQLLGVLARATTVPDIITVQDRLQYLQADIDSLEGQRRLLEDQTSFGSLAVTVAEPGADRPAAIEARADGDGGLGSAWDEARRGFGNALEWIVARSGKAVVLAAAALALYGLGLLAVRRVRRTAI